MTRRVLLLVNPAAGRRSGAASVGQAAARVLRDGGLDVHEVVAATPEAADRHVGNAVAERVDAVVVCGGDGLVHLAVQHLAGTPVALGLVPAGTGNDTARAMGAPLDDPVAAARRILAWRPRPMDLGRASGRYFTTVLAAGFDAAVSERAATMAWPRGPWRYTLATAAELRTLVARPYVLDLGAEVRRTEAMLVAVGNGASFGGGMRIAEGAAIDDGLLDVVVIGPLSRRELVRVFPKLRQGTHVRHPSYERHRVRSVTIAAPGIVGWADGERLGALPLTVECAPAALQVLW